MIDESKEIRIVNEFADVTVKKVDTRNGHRLSIQSQKGSIELDATSLECISWQDKELFSELLGENPRGPQVPQGCQR